MAEPVTNHLSDAQKKLSDVREEIRNDRTIFNTQVLWPFVVTFFVASCVATATLPASSWMHPLAGEQRFMDIWADEDNFLRHYRATALSLLIFMVVIAYVTDMTSWHKCWKYLFYPWMLFIGIFALWWLAFNNEPVLCLGLAIVFTVSSAISIRNKFFKETPSKYLAYAECLAYAVLSIMFGFGWLAWFTLAGGSKWLGEDTWASMDDIIKTISPLGQAIAYAGVSYLAYLRSRWKRTRQEGRTVDYGAELRMAVFLLACVMGLCWIAVWGSLGSRVASTFMLQIAFVALLCTTVYILNWIGVKRLKAHLAEDATVATLSGIVQSDWIKAIFIFFLGFLIPPLIVIEFVHQLVRHRMQQCHLLEDDFAAFLPKSTADLDNTDPDKRWITKEAASVLRAIGAWNWTSICSKSIYLGLFSFVVQAIAGSGLNLFLSWFNEVLEPYSILFTTSMLFVVLLALFVLVPVVSGNILYWCVGLVLIPKFVQQPIPEDPLHRWFVGVGASSVLCLVLKLTACAIEMKVFGGRYKNDAPIKKLCGMHTDAMKAIKYILEEPGMYMAKIYICVGIVDWLCSVMCGIMGLPVLPILIYTLPCIIVIVPSAFSAGFTVCPEEVFAADSPLCSLMGGMDGLLFNVAVLVATAMMLMAFFNASVLLDHVKEEGLYDENWMKDPQEDEMVALAKEDEIQEALFLERTQWKHAPPYVRGWLVVGMVMSAFTFVIALLGCWIGCAFETFKPHHSIDEDLNGNPLNLVRPLGWVQMAAAFVSLIAILVTRRWTDAAVAAAVAAGETPQEGGEQVEMTEPKAAESASAGTAPEAAAAATAS